MTTREVVIHICDRCTARVELTLDHPLKHPTGWIDLIIDRHLSGGAKEMKSLCVDCRCEFDRFMKRPPSRAQEADEQVKAVTRS